MNAAPVTVVQKAGSFFSRLIRNKWFWIILISLIVFLILRRNWPLIKARFFGRITGDFQPGDITEGRKAQLRGLATNIQSQLTTIGSSADGVLKQLNALNDNEFRYTVKYYDDSLARKRGQMYKDIDEKWMYFSNEDETAMARIMSLGLR